MPKEVQTILGTNNNVPQKETVVNNYAKKKTLLKGRAESKKTQACRQQTMSSKVLYLTNFKKSILNNVVEFKARGNFYGSANTGSTTPDKMAEGYEGGKGRNDWDNDAIRNRKTKGQDDDVAEQESEGNTLGDIGKSNGDFEAEELMEARL